MKITAEEISGLVEKFAEIKDTDYDNTFDIEKQTEICTYFAPLIRQAEIMIKKYDVVCTNPPYMGGGFSPKLDEYIKKNYADSKSDLFAVFIEKCGFFSKSDGYYAMITQHAWMFLSSYEKLRKKLQLKTTVNMAHLGARAFDEISGEVVQTTAFVNQNQHIHNYLGTYARLIEGKSENEKSSMFLSGKYNYTANADNFSKIPGSPVAYWVSENIINLYKKGLTMESIAHPKVGMQTSNNDKYLRLWFEVNYSEFNGKSEQLKWIKYLKGGSYRKWYGNLEYLLWYNYNPNYILQQKNARVLDLDFLSKKKCTWTDLTSGKNSFRYVPDDTFYDISGHCFFPNEKNQFWLLAYANTKFFSEMKKVFNSSFHCQVGDVAKIVIPELEDIDIEKISKISKQNVNLSKTDWDSYETSWDFKKYPLV